MFNNVNDTIMSPISLSERYVITVEKRFCGNNIANISGADIFLFHN